MDKYWTTIGNPGSQPGALVGTDGRVTPTGAAWSIIAVMVPDGEQLLSANGQPSGVVRQRLQDRLPVVATAFEYRTWRLSTEAWCFSGDDGAEWVAVQAVVFNLSDDATSGRFYFLMHPLRPDDWGVISKVSYHDGGFYINDLPAVYLPAAPDAGLDCWNVWPTLWPSILAGNTAADNEEGRAAAIAGYSFNIEPWEEAEFVALLPIWRERRTAQQWPQLPETPYGVLKGAATREWQGILAGGMHLSLPILRFDESWDANRAHMAVMAESAAEDNLVAAALQLALGSASGVIPPTHTDDPEPVLDDEVDQGLIDLRQVLQEARRFLRLHPAQVWRLFGRYLNLTNPTFAWPMVLNIRRATVVIDGHSAAVTAAWLLFLRDIVLYEHDEQLVIGAGLPIEWLAGSADIVARQAPTTWGKFGLSIHCSASEIRLDIDAANPPPNGYVWWLPWLVARVETGDEQIAATGDDLGRSFVHLPPDCHSAVAHRKLAEE